MIELGIQERSAISALQWLPVEGIRAQYAEYLKDCEGCNRIEILRAIVIYRIQEKFYGQRVSRETERLMEKAVEGDKLLHAPADDVRSSRRKLVRNWKGKDYEVFVFVDGETKAYMEKFINTLDKLGGPELITAFSNDVLQGEAVNNNDPLFTELLQGRAGYNQVMEEYRQIVNCHDYLTRAATIEAIQVKMIDYFDADDM